MGGGGGDLFYIVHTHPFLVSLNVDLLKCGRLSAMINFNMPDDIWETMPDISINIVIRVACREFLTRKLL